MDIYKEISLNLLPDDIILDIGASVGLESKKLYDVLGPCKVISVEPNVDSVLEIYALIKSHNMESDWFVENACLDTSCGFKTFGFQHSSGMHNRLNGSLDEFNWKTWHYEGTKTVRTKTIQQICPNPSFFKMDIERHEYIVLPELVKLPSIKGAIIELHGPDYPLNVVDFFDTILKDTTLKVKGWYSCNQNQTDKEDDYYPIEPMAHIPTGSYCYIILEAK